MRQKFSYQPVVEEAVEDLQWATRKQPASPQLDGAASAIAALPRFAKAVGNRIGFLLAPPAQFMLSMFVGYDLAI